MAEKFYTILTNIGKASIANASALGTKVDFKLMALGDSNGSYYNPTETQTQLVNEVYRSQLNHVQLDSKNDNWIKLSMVIPGNVGGFTVREVGVFNTEGDLLAVGKIAETYKPLMENGSIKDLTIDMILEVSNTSVVTIKIDPSVVLATKKYVDNLAGVGRTTETVKKNADNIVDIKSELGAHKADNTKEHGVLSTLKTAEKTNLVGAINEVFQNANNLKSDWAGVVGSPLLSTDTSAQLKNKTQIIKNNFATKLTNKGVVASGTETLTNLVNKIDDMSNNIILRNGCYAVYKNHHYASRGAVFDKNNNNGVMISSFAHSIFTSKSPIGYSCVIDPDQGLNDKGVFMVAYKVEIKGEYPNHSFSLKTASVECNSNGVLISIKYDTGDYGLGIKLNHINGDVSITQRSAITLANDGFVYTADNKAWSTPGYALLARYTKLGVLDKEFVGRQAFVFQNYIDNTYILVADSSKSLVNMSDFSNVDASRLAELANINYSNNLLYFS